MRDQALLRVVEEAQKASNPDAIRLTKLSTADIFADLPSIDWISRDLALCAGRPVQLIGKGFSGKTLTGQTLALCVAAGSPIWGKFPCKAGKVLHLDYEQGAYATRARYQRLLRGMDLAPHHLEDRLDLVAKPDLYLTSPGAQDVLCREVDGYQLVLIDALRGAVLDVDENDSKIRKYIDLCGTVSEKTGACFVFIHHGGKTIATRDGSSARDSRDEGRGSSAIFDAAGSVYAMQRGSDGLIQVTQTKQAAEACGKALEPFRLRIVDKVDEHGNPNGIAVEWVAEDCTAAAPTKAIMAAMQAVLEVVRSKPKCSGAFIRSTVTVKTTTTIAAIEELARSGFIVNVGTKAKPEWQAKEPREQVGTDEAF